MKINVICTVQRKVQAREAKTSDKERAKRDPTHYVATFDLEDVLDTPCSKVSTMLCKRKLSCYNLTFYSLGSNLGVCYLWDESEGGHGSNEIETCLIMHLTWRGYPQTLRTYACTPIPVLVNQNQDTSHGVRFYTQCYGTRTHHMECDSTHSAI